ncbi:hypothetical protein [Bradyrhizobium sp. BR 1432]
MITAGAVREHRALPPQTDNLCKKTTKEADKPPNFGADCGFVALIDFH